MAEKVIFLDRDGTINVDRGYVYRVEDFEFASQAVEALVLLSEHYKLAIVTNQSGIAAGYYHIDDMRRLHDHLAAELMKAGVTLDAIAYCPHGRDSSCDCRKPAPGMAAHIEEQLGEVDYGNSWMVGDKELDVQFGQAIGVKTALLRSEYWQEDELAVAPDIIVDSLYEAADTILK